MFFNAFICKCPNTFWGHSGECVFSFLTYTVYPLQEAGFTGFMRNLRGRDQEKVGKRKEEL